jgi:hypothetical protein
MRSQHDVVEDVTQIVANNREKRISVVGTFCCGKSCLANEVAEIRDMDHLVLPKLLEEEKAQLLRPWTPEVHGVMARLACKHVGIKPSEPVIGTVLLDCDLVVLRRIFDGCLPNVRRREAPSSKTRSSSELIWNTR